MKFSRCHVVPTRGTLLAFWYDSMHMAISIVHLSDFHFGDKANSVVGKLPALAAAIRAADPTCRHYGIVLSGDIADHGNASQYAIGKQFLLAHGQREEIGVGPLKWTVIERVQRQVPRPTGDHHPKHPKIPMESTTHPIRPQTLHYPVIEMRPAQPP